MGVCHETFLLDDVQHRERYLAGHCISAEGVEVAVGLREFVHDLGSGHEGSNGMSIAHWLSHCDQVRYDTMALEAPHVEPGSPESRLHLISNEEAAGCMDFVYSLCQEARGMGGHSVAAEYGIDEQGCGLDSRRTHFLDAVMYARAEFGGVGFSNGRCDREDVRSERLTGDGR